MASVVEPPLERSPVTSLQVRPARGALLGTEDPYPAPAQTGASSQTPPVQSRALVPADKAGSGGPLAAPADQGEIFFVEHALGEPVDSRLALINNRDSARASGYRLLRQRLVEHGDPQVVLVTSARSREGKTTLAANLALAYAELGHKRVLLVEANFRAAALGELFGFKPPCCLSVQLERSRDRRADPWVVVQVVPVDLHVVAVQPNCCPSCARVLMAGASFCSDCRRKVANEAPRLDRVTFVAAIRRFREAFDYVVIDGPSVLEGADANLIQESADGIVMSARGRHSDLRALKRAMDQVAPAPVLGVALADD